MILSDEALPWVVGGGALVVVAVTVGASIVYKLVSRRRYLAHRDSGVNTALLEHLEQTKKSAPKQIAYNTIMDSTQSTPASHTPSTHTPVQQSHKPSRHTSSNQKMFLQLWLNRTANEGYPLEDIVIGLETPDHIQHNSDGSLKFATLHKLVENLIKNGNCQHFFKEEFFATYTSFTTPNKLITTLISFSNGFHNDNDVKHESVCLDLIEFWCRNNLNDLNLCTDKERLFTTLFKYVNKSDLAKSKNVASILSTHIKEAQPAPLQSFMVNTPLQKKEVNIQDDLVNDSEDSELEAGPIYPEGDSDFQTRNEFNILEWSPKEIARQLTIIEGNLLKQISCYELCKSRYLEHNMDKSAPHIAESIHFFNNFSLWLVSLILTFDDVEMRAATIQFLIELVEQLVGFGNFNSTMSVLGAINNSAVTRLKATNELLPEESIEMLEAVNELTSSAKKFFNLREAVEGTPGCIPFLGIFLTDLSLIESVNKDKKVDDVELINWNRCKYTANICKQLQVCQSGLVKYQEIEFLQTHLRSVVSELSEDDLYERSLCVEPRSNKA
ncbi:RasGEF [Acrasis kona]|uniref:RasGEF n=1 Tax=Acrasis kona TaxID=1008807 RepID=A0AAW2ZJ08_9EUKA